MAVGRQFFPFVSSYKPDLEILLSEQLGAPVTIGDVEGSWRWLDPVLIVSDIELKHDLPKSGDQKTASHLRINTFYIHLSVLQSLLNGALQFQSVEASGITLPLHQNSDGEWDIPGLPVNRSASSTNFDEIFSVLEQPSLVISDVTVELLSSTKSQSSWVIPSAIMTFDGRAFSASGEILDSDSKSPFARFSAKGAGWILSKEFTGKLFLDWASSPLINQYLSAYQWKGIHLEKINASGRLWLELLEGDILSLQGEIDAETLQWQSEKGSVLPLKNIKADFFWSQLSETNILSIYDLSMEWSSYRWTPSNYALHFSEEAVNVNGQQVNLSMLTALLLATNVLPPKGQKALADYHPGGSLTNVELTIPLNQRSAIRIDETSPLFQLEANIEDVSSQAVGGAPGATGMTGYLSLNDREGAVFVDSDDFTLSFPNLFLDGWSFEKSQVIVDWSIADSGDINVYSSGINLYLTEKSLVFGAFSLLLSDTKEDVLGLRVGVNNVDASRAYQLVPYHAVDSGIYDWLKSSIKGGVVESGLYVGYGSIESDAPAHSFTSSMVFNTSGARLLFDAGWPELTELNSKIFLQNGYLNIDAPKVSYRGAALTGTHVELVADLDEAESWLNVVTHTRPNEQDVQYWLNDSPVSEHLGKLSEQLIFQGEIGVTIELGIPLHDMAQNIEYNLAFDVQDAEFKHSPSDVVFKDVTGLATLSSKTGLSAESVALEVFGHPAVLNMQSDIFQEGMDTQLVLVGDISVSALTDQLPIDNHLPVAGQTAYTAALTLSSDDQKNAQFSLTSDLQGISILLPEPFSKVSSNALPLKIQVEITDDAIALDAGLGDLASVNASFENGDFKAGSVLIGGGEAEIASEDGLFITGALNQLTVAPWIDYISSNAANDESSLIKEVALKVGSLNIYDQLFNSVEAVIKSEGDSWSIVFEGDDLAGTVSLPSKGNKPNIDLRKIRLTIPETAELGQDVSPSDIPEMVFLIDDLVINDVSYGKWSADLVKKDSSVVANGVVANGIVAKDVKVSLAGTDLKGRLSWVKDVYGISTTILTATIAGGNIGAISKALNKSEVLNSEKFSSEVSLVWSESPTELELADLSGRVVLSLENGTLLDAKSATEVFKVFGILNAEAIKRRLTLDFSDLYQKGLGYDRIEGVARIDKGTLTLENPLAIQGPSSAYKFTGSADLNAETLNMDMVVILPLTKNLPLAALFLGAPQIGGAVWVIDKLLGEPLSKLTSATYELKGRWDDPQIKLKNVFDRTERFEGLTPSQRMRAE
ncbi:TIGR02099 family protein [Alkalimarinus alittae]|uniref:TIGR02099 family protein n=2 Tax=Alkalimarinus alittae TaxID=2961619 RepID=A0ABY6MZG5_9ALTE|nr:TIGR02099 family protein [Alkalimarinus alittae]